MIRVLHFSDVHVQEPLSTMPTAELMGKRLLAAGNLWLSRGRLFREVPQKLEALARFAAEQAIDFAICTGDYTALGSEAEHAAARRAIDALTRRPLGFCTVPGNHDVYLADAVRDARFERHFAAELRSDLPALAVDGPYPLVRLIGEELAVIGVNSAKPNPSPFSSAGHVPEPQLEALARLLDDPLLARRRLMVMTHYGVLRRDGRPDTEHHGLDNVDALLRVCARRPDLLLVHGHIHHRYHHAKSAAYPWLFCAGSATHRGREGLWIYELKRGGLRALPGRYRDGAYELTSDGVVEVFPAR